MNILAFSDIHMATSEAANIPGIGEADVVILNGDLTNFGGVIEVRRVLDDILALNPKVLAQFGNLDRLEINEYLENLGINLHGQARLVGGEVCLVGIGGSNVTPFSTPSEFSEEEIFTITSRALAQGREYIALAEPLYNRRIPLILVSHVPPYNTRIDRIHSGKHVGSTALRSLIESYRPDLCITGHIHEGKGTDAIGTTPLYNTGMLKRGGWLTISVNNAQLKVHLQ
jgi:uncharacterized protein